MSAATLTTLQLLAYISTALLFQVVVGAGVMVWRKRAQMPLKAGPEEAALQASGTFTGAWSGWRDFRVARRDFEDAALSQCSFYLQPIDGAPLPAFKPGQYLTFSLTVPDGMSGSAERELTRCYSLSDRPDSARYRITVKRALPPTGRPSLPAGVCSSHFHERVHEGDVLRVKAPAGRFFIDPDATVPAVFIAGGIGITPMLSMLRWCMAEQPERSLRLYYGVRNGADHAFKPMLAELAATHPAFKLHVVYSSPEPGDTLGRDHQHTGIIDIALLRNSLPHGRHQFYVCGPPPMMQSLVPALREWGVDEPDIHFEAFGPATVQPATLACKAPLAATPTAIEIRFDRSGRTLAWDGQDANLLDFAERHGVAVDSGCRTGSCGACETKLVCGSVSYAETPDYVIANGHCLLCVGKPQSALVVEA